jgi:hypothetical protein
MTAYGAPFEVRAVQPSEIEGGANALNMTQVSTCCSSCSAKARKCDYHMHCAVRGLLPLGAGEVAL